MKDTPVLRELLKQDQLMAYLINLEPSDLVNDTIKFLQFAVFASQNSTIPEIQNAVNVLMHYQIT